MLIKEDHSVTILEDIEYEVYEKLASQSDSKNIHCTINKKEVHFSHISSIVWSENKIDWDYGY